MVILLILLLPIVVTPVMLWGFAGQLAARAYPAEWYTMNDRLKIDPRITLFLPWHQYMKFDFSGRIIAVPAEKFFATRMIVSDDPEFKGIKPTIPDEMRRHIGRALEEPEQLPKVLKQYGISRILVTKENDYKKYDYLRLSTNYALVHQDRLFLLYEVRERKQ